MGDGLAAARERGRRGPLPRVRTMARNANSYLASIAYVMSLLCWNCRGLGADPTVGELRFLVKKFRPSLLFLSQTRMRDSKARNFMWSLGYDTAFAVSSDGFSGGLVLYALSSMSVKLLAYSSHLIDVRVCPVDGPMWRATFVYGESKRELRHIFWDRLRFLRAQWNGPWICAGDFNETLYADEHLGARERCESQMSLFRECLHDCGLSDMGFVGPKFTWSNKQDDGRNVKVRLDCAVANADFVQLFEDYRVENVITTSSDHYALYVSLKRESFSMHRPTSTGQHPFKYEAAWMRAPDYFSTVEDAWVKNTSGTRSLGATWENLGRMSNTLKEWSHHSFGSVKKEIKKLERRLANLRRFDTSGVVPQEEKDVERRLCELFEREEIMARQHSRIDWLREGDRNTSFFQAKASAR